MVETGAIVVGSISTPTLIITKLKCYEQRMVVVTMGAASWIRV